MTLTLAERLHCIRLMSAYLARRHFGHEEIFTAGRCTSYAAHHRNLANMREGVGDGALEEWLGGSVHRLVRCEVVVEGLESSEEACFFFGPSERGRVVPALASLHRAQRPVKQVAHMRKDFDRLASATIKSGEAVGRAIQGAGGAVSKSGDGVSKEFALLVHTGKYTAVQMRQRPS
jgi:hypothetical protein